MQEKSNHLPSEKLAALVDNVLSEDETNQIMHHLDTCPECYQQYAEIMALTAMSLELEEQELHTDSVVSARNEGVLSFEEGRQELAAQNRETKIQPVFTALLVVAAAVILFFLLPSMQESDPEHIYQKGIDGLAQVNPEFLLRFRPPKELPTGLWAALETNRGAGDAFDDSVSIDQSIEGLKAFLETHQNQGRDSAYIEVAINLSFLYVGQGQYDRAMQTADKGGEDQRARFLRLMALFLRNPDRFDAQDIDGLVHLVEDNPDSSFINYNAGRIFRELGKTELAEEAWSKFLDADPSSPRVQPF